MKDDIAQIVHNLRGSIQSCVGFIKFANDWLETRDESNVGYLVDYCNVASDSTRKVLGLIDELDKAICKFKLQE